MASVRQLAGVGQAVRRGRPGRAVSRPIQRDGLEPGVDYLVPSDEVVSEIVGELGELGTSFAMLVGAALAGIEDGYSHWVPKWKCQSEGINMGHLYQLVGTGHVKLSGTGKFAPTVMLPQRDGSTSGARKDARTSEYARKFIQNG